MSRIFWKFFSKLTDRFDDRPILKGVLKAVPVIVGVAIGSEYAHQAGWFRSLENTQIDAYISSSSIELKHTQIVQINDDDYAKYFSSRSPLNPEVLSKIIGKIQTGNPSAIVVDIDTSDQQFANATVPKGKMPIIWARTAIVESQDANVSSHRMSENPIFQLDRIWGQSDDERVSTYGVAMLPQSGDGIIRYFCRSLLIRNGGKVEPQNTLAWQAVEAIGKAGSIEPIPGKKLFLPLAKDARQLKEISLSQLDALAGSEGWKELVREKIVILGGSYRAARDFYITPVGEMSGAEVIAQIIDGEIQKKVPAEPEPTLFFLINFCAGVLLAYINCRFMSGYVLFAGFFLIPVFGYCVSLFAAQIALVWVSFLPVLYAVQFHSFWELVRDYECLRAANKKLSLKPSQ